MTEHKLTFGDKESGKVIIGMLENLLEPYRIERHECDCEYCNYEDGLQEVTCGRCRRQVLSCGEIGRDTSDAAIEKYMKKNKVVCDHCGTRMYDASIAETIVRIQAEYGLSEIKRPVLFQ